MDAIVSYEFTGILISAGIIIVLAVLIGIIVNKIRSKK